MGAMWKRRYDGNDGYDGYDGICGRVVLSVAWAHCCFGRVGALLFCVGSPGRTAGLSVFWAHRCVFT